MGDSSSEPVWQRGLRRCVAWVGAGSDGRWDWRPAWRVPGRCSLGGIVDTCLGPGRWSSVCWDADLWGSLSSTLGCRDGYTTYSRWDTAVCRWRLWGWMSTRWGSPKAVARRGGSNTSWAESNGASTSWVDGWRKTTVGLSDSFFVYRERGRLDRAGWVVDVRLPWGFWAPLSFWREREKGWTALLGSAWRI